MKTKTLIQLLQEADPSGEMECALGSEDIWAVEVIPAHYDGTLEVLSWQPNGPYRALVGAKLVAKGRRVRLQSLSIATALLDYPSIPVDVEADNDELRAHLERVVAGWRREADES